ncbi:sporulation membrane protein YtaF [Candidatus Formimonas warabiya]|nr:sporulation membrane protein YtaF [Candidatus Formimonas warabiya]
MLILSMILFALAVSVDGFGVGFAYGLKNIIIPRGSLLLINLISSVVIAVSMFFGKIVVIFISLETARLIGAVLLAGMGLFMLFHAWVQKKEEMALPREDTLLLRLRIPPLGILVQILKEPTKADMDKSGIIDFREALLLGFALAMDALGSGFAFAVVGFPPILTAISVGVCQFMMVSAAGRLARCSVNNRFIKKTSFVPGLLILLLGLSKLK